MIQKNKYFVLFLVLAVSFTLIGCGSSKKGDVSIFENNVPTIANNAQLTAFDKQLGEIKDQASAEKAVSSFITYVDSRIDRTEEEPTAQSLETVLGQNLIKQIARQEVAARNGEAAKVMAVGGEEVIKTPIDIGTVTDKVNELGSDSGVRVDDNTVLKAKTVVEASIPNLNPEKKSSLTPLGAMTVGYALMTGDDGTASENSVKLPTDKVNSFVKAVTQ
ncbi:hypothetical protein A2291_06045 [candidate division WOR-1 bacterium RIFOXYB2_FULL_42_35]|uniref:Lipoprotein n=1 Tax=candidate division WOR-1 bacterium RIFOXYC2_FULL_41_25 TaxID=1802586 RepID=A0A1F4TJL3_UNCSA|nr:MAG: hypothetical protein A2247_01705 [candidate division WOR-1 bacterium RIFOXYA2_FULL_41_14]OGC22286.1 MAG: hypothetical protein A2291_06045 [candidate division WOR-1 bacterium RIFOXYB2_FULL_42_35]OGC32905.1 MAG: hypothetical protein A2462_00720 [candidate division WOR-1 bacterium RIFOXYC2_FULL_41_25]OGC41713.1 MAG: hypothetical protein A2548_04960 [candidate division WOR-1 bacterium RIFOXYD2_FULL_41_8]